MAFTERATRDHPDHLAVMAFTDSATKVHLGIMAFTDSATKDQLDIMAFTDSAT